MEPKPEIIIELEKKLNLSIHHLASAYLDTKDDELKNGFSTNSSGKVIMLRLTECHVDPEWMAPFSKIKILYLINCGIADISFLTAFRDLLYLNLSFNNISNISPLHHLKLLKYINLISNEIFDLSPLYTQFKDQHLLSLNITANPLIYPSYEVAEQGKQAIALWFDNILQIARDKILECKQKKSPKLDLGKIGLTDLSLIPELFECRHLKELILSNEWMTRGTGKSPFMTYSANKGIPNNIFHIPQQIEQLTNLEVLITGGDMDKLDVDYSWFRITTFEPFQKLRKLKHLNISNGIIEGEINITSLKLLETLIANDNLITGVRTFYLLKSLTHLNLSNNMLENADFLNKMPNAKTIDLHANAISNLYNIRDTILKRGISDSKWQENTINIANNPLDVPNMQIISQGMSAVRGFFKQYEAERSVQIPPYQNDDVKIILVGNSDAGKSSLAERLITGKWNDQLPTTHWMNIKAWQPVRNNRKYNIRIFDFGGQEYYHDTHYLFFSNHTAYVMLWNQQTNNYDECEIQQLQKNNTKSKVTIQGFPIPYWMESIAYHTKRKVSEEDGAFTKNDFTVWEAKIGEAGLSTPKSVLFKLIQPPNILVTQSKVASSADTHYLNQYQLNTAYPAIYEFANISVKTGRGMEHFQDLLFEMIDKMPITERECLGTWGAIKQEIETGVKEEHAEMSLSDFRKFCNQIISEMPEVKNAGIKSTNILYFSIADSKSYAQYLNDIGLILYFPDNKLLKDKVFLRQNDVLKKIYDILEGLYAISGKFDHKHILKALKKETYDEECTTITELMKHFKIAFPHPSQEGSFIAPLYLPALPSKSISIFLDDGHQPSYRFLFQGFIHKHIILEFFHLYGQQALRDEHGQQYYYWKNGIVIKDDLTQGIVMVRFINATATAKAFIDVYSLGKNGDKSLLKKITDELERLTFDMNVKKAVTANGTDFVPVDVIHAAEDSNQWIFHYNDQYFDLKLFRAHLKNELKMKKIFISYSKADAHYLQQFENHLSALKRNGSISTWNCRQLLPGEKWDGKIKKELEEADIIIFLVSSDFLATDYIWDIEIKYAIDKENTNPDAVKVVPIIIRSCVWEDTPLSAYNTAPKKAQVITLSNNLDEAFTEAVKDLKKIL